MITASHNPRRTTGSSATPRPAARSFPPTTPGSSPASRRVSDREIPEKPFDGGRGRRLDRPGRPRGRRRLHRGRRRRVGQPGPRRSRSSTRRCTASARPRSPPRSSAAGFGKVNILASQRTPDGDFPNVPGHVSNPEIPRTLEAAIAEAKATGADLVLASDPDADRIGVGLPVTGDPSGDWTTLDGNQIGVLLAAFVMKQTKATRPAPARPLPRSRPWSRARWPAPWPRARGSGSRTTCSSASSGSPSGSTRPGRPGSSSASRSRTAT